MSDDIPGMISDDPGRQKLFNVSSKRALAASAAFTVVLAVYYHLCWPTFGDFVRAIDFSDIPFCDFVVFYYRMGQEVFTTKTPVTGFEYSPFFAIVFGFFGMFSLEVSTTLWVLLLIGSMAALGIGALVLVSPDTPTRFLLPFLAVFLTSFPLLHNFKWGQVGVLLTLLVVLALLADRNNHWILSSLCLAVATSLKYFPALFVLPFVFRKDARVVGGFIAWCVLLFAGVPMLVFGISPTISFLGQIVHGTMKEQIAAGGPNSQYFVNVVSRWTSGLATEPGSMKIAVRALSFLVVETVLVLIFLLMRSHRTNSMEWSFVLLFLVIPFFVATSWPHYLVFLPFCQLFLGSEIRDGNRRRVVKILVWGLILLSVVCSSVFLFQLMGSWEKYTGAGFLFVADLLLLISSTVLLLPPVHLFRRPQDASPGAPAPTTSSTNQ